MKRPRPNSRKKRRARWRLIRGHVAANRLGLVSAWVVDRVLEEQSWYFGRHHDPRLVKIPARVLVIGEPGRFAAPVAR